VLPSTYFFPSLESDGMTIVILMCCFLDRLVVPYVVVLACTSTSVGHLFDTSLAC
jgi:hypothetical protein